MHNPLPRPSVTSWTQSGNRQTFIFLFTVWAEHKMIIKNITYSSFESPYKSLRYEKRSGGVRRGGRERRYEAGLSCLICSICAKECRVEERRTQRDDGRRIPRHISSFSLCSKPLNVKLPDSDAAGGATATARWAEESVRVCVCRSTTLFLYGVSVWVRWNMLLFGIVISPVEEKMIYVSICFFCSIWRPPAAFTPNLVCEICLF